MSIQWKIEQMSDRRLEAEIARYNYELFVRGHEGSNRILDLLWEEFDRRMDAGTMTDDTEGLLNDVRKY